MGMAARFAAEKGVEVLLDAFPKVLEKYPNAQVLFSGQYENVIGERAYSDRLMPRIHSLEENGHWKFLGVLNPEQMAAFYPNLDVLVVPSLNSTESFGLVQIEAMMNNVPCVASALPGVRRPVQMHGMGKVVPIGDPEALAQALLALFVGPEKGSGKRPDIAQNYAPDKVAAAYEGLFEDLLAKKKK
jgi:glycosyltransferase involved in cell wall biosynthesis